MWFKFDGSEPKKSSPIQSAYIFLNLHKKRQIIDRIFYCIYGKQNQILCDLHFADVALMETSDFMQQLRSFKPQSLGCAVARRKSSTTLIFPLPPQACSGLFYIFKCFFYLLFFLNIHDD